MTWFRSHKPIVVCFDANGCMAHDHQFQWTGEIVGHKPAKVYGAPDDTYTAAIVKIHKRRNDPYDSRDRDMGTEYPLTAELQEITPQLFFLYR